MNKIYESRLPLRKNSCQFLNSKHLILWTQGPNVLLSDKELSQSKVLYTHPRDVLCFAVNSQETLVASGEEGINSDIFVFSLEQVVSLSLF